MKKLLSLAGIAALVLLMCTSCTKLLGNLMILGEWELTKSEITTTVGDASYEDTEELEPGECIIFFDPEGSFETYSDMDGDVEGYGEYEVKGKTLTLTAAGQSVDFKIEKLNVTELVIKGTYSFSDEGESGSETVKAYFKRVMDMEDEE